MKKQYEKPDVSFESFVADEVVCAGSIGRLNIAGAASINYWSTYERDEGIVD